MTLAIYALSTHLPASNEHSSLLGTVIAGANYHLYEPAGNHSRVSTVRRGVTRMYSAPYSTPTAAADERTADLASVAVAHLVNELPQTSRQVSAIIHSQCSLDQQILGSGCLRVQHDHFPGARSAMTIGQLGTAGLPTILGLLSRRTTHRELTCVSASDKWVAPFVRRIPGLVSYGDAAASCLVGTPKPGSPPIAILQDLAISCVPPVNDLWRTSGDTHRTELLAHTREVIEMLLGRHPSMRREDILIAGDGYGASFSGDLASATGLSLLQQPLPDVHLSSASLLFALSAVVDTVNTQGLGRYALLWTASPSGHAGAVLVHVRPGARRIAHGWFTQDQSIDAMPTMQ